MADMRLGEKFKLKIVYVLYVYLISIFQPLSFLQS